MDEKPEIVLEAILRGVEMQEPIDERSEVTGGGVPVVPESSLGAESPVVESKGGRCCSRRR